MTDNGLWDNYNEVVRRHDSSIDISQKVTARSKLMMAYNTEGGNYIQYMFMFMFMYMYMYICSCTCTCTYSCTCMFIG